MFNRPKLLNAYFDILMEFDQIDLMQIKLLEKNFFGPTKRKLSENRRSSFASITKENKL